MSIENAVLRVRLTPILCTAAVDPGSLSVVGPRVGFAAIFASFSNIG